MSEQRIKFHGKMAFGEPPGKCIYCGSDGSPDGLTDEHLVAYCLANDAYLPASSCTVCNKTTSYIEGYAGRQIFGPMRKHFQIQSRRKRGDLGDVDVTFTKPDGTSEVRQIPRDKLPAMVALPILTTAGFFNDQVAAPITAFTPWIWTAEDPLPHLKPFFNPLEVHAHIDIRINPLVFAKMLAKIAHAVSVGWIGLESFRPYLPPLILGNDDKAAYLIGGAKPPTDPDPPQPYSDATLHHILKLQPMSSPGKADILVAEIRLFKHIGSPTYYVIVGELLPIGLERLTPKDGGSMS
jgi:hypothetical protein